MKRALALALALSGSAFGIQYAILTESSDSFQWTTPGPRSLPSTGKTLDVLVKSMGCKGGTYQDFLDCAAMNRWELVTIHTYLPAQSSMPYTMWVFKKQ